MKTDMGRKFRVAVIPLPDAVLFPGTSLPLHIFGRRDRRTIRDVMGEKIPLAVSLVTPAEPPSRDSNFYLSNIGSTAAVEALYEHTDGTSDVVVTGQKRIRLLDMVQEKPYFVMQAELLEIEACVELVMRRTFDELIALSKAWVLLNPKVPDQLTLAVEELHTPAELTDFFAFHFFKRVSDKQAYLNIPNPVERAEMLAAFLETDLVRLSKRHDRFKNMLLFH